MKNRILIIPDIHQRYEWIIPCLTELKNSYDKVVFLGDMFDDFNEHPNDVQETALLTQHLINTKDFGELIFILSNHDIAYRWWKSSFLGCSGNEMWKYEIISNILKDKDWDKFKLFHFERDSKGREWYFSHGGISEKVFAHPMEGVTKKIINEKCKKALIDAAAGIYNEVLAAGIGRGNYRQPIGGITWLDWRSEFVPIENINQIVGHTPLHQPEKYKNEPQYVIDDDIPIEKRMNRTVKLRLIQPVLNSENWCFDTHSKHIGWWVDGEVSYEKNRWL